MFADGGDGAFAPVSADFADGRTAQVRDVMIYLDLGHRAGDGNLVIREDDTVIARWSSAGLREKRDQADKRSLVMSHIKHPEARLTVYDAPMIALLRDAVPELGLRDIPKGTIRRIVTWAGGAIAAVLLIVFVIVPALSDQLAVLVPPESEQQLGEASVRQIGWLLEKIGDEPLAFCSEPRGLAALNKMVGRFDGAYETPYDLQVRVMDHEMENAFAVPGGQIVIFEGLLKAASSAEEIAGVLGHELGHVVNRDPTRLALRSAGTVGILGLILGDFSGGAFVLVLTERLIAASYAQDAETDADDFAYEILAKSGMSTRPFANFFERMAKVVGEESGPLSHLASHPNLSQRAADARRADTIGDGRAEPVLSDSEWAALRGICAETAPVDKP